MFFKIKNKNKFGKLKTVVTKHRYIILMLLHYEIRYTKGKKCLELRL